MTFALTPASAFTASVSTISAATANTWRTAISQSLDTVGGGAYANVATIDWSAGSAGWRFYAAVAIKSTGTLNLDAGATVNISADPSLYGTMRVGIGGAGGGVRWYATSTFQVDDTVAMSIAGDATWTGASSQTHASGSSDVYSSGSTFTIASGATASLNLGGASAAGVTFIGANGAAVWNGASTATWQTASVSLWQSGATMTIASGTITTWTIGGGGAAGAATWGATSTQTHASGSADTYSTGSNFTINTGAIVNVTIGETNAGTLTFGALAVTEHKASSTDTYDSSSNLNLNGTTTRTGKLVLSGTGAYTQLRWRNAADADDAAVDGRHYDVVSITLNSGFSRTFVLVDGAAGVPFSFKIQVYSVSGGAEFLNVNWSSGLLYSIAPGSGKVQTVEFMWSGGAWTTGIVGAAV